MTDDETSDLRALLRSINTTLTRIEVKQNGLKNDIERIGSETENNRREYRAIFEELRVDLTRLTDRFQSQETDLKKKLPEMPTRSKS
jgi:chromosome segregation ATPase